MPNITPKKEYIKLYTEFLTKHLSLKQPVTVVADASNGATSIVLKELQNIPNLNLILINDKPDPEFPAHGPNPLASGALEQLSKKVLEVPAHLGVAFDADGDRAFFVDETGVALPSYVVAYILFKQAPAPFIADELVYLSLQALDLFSREELIVSKVGSFFVKQALMVREASTGAEFSGHYYFRDFFGADSGIFTMIKILNALSIDNRPLSVMRTSLPEHVVTNSDIKLQKTTWPSIEEKLHEHFGSNGQIYNREGLTFTHNGSWINIRASNTEPLVRITAGSKNNEENEHLITDVKNIINSLEQ